MLRLVSGSRLGARVWQYAPRLVVSREGVTHTHTHISTAHQVRAYTRFTRFSTGFFSFSSAFAALRARWYALL